MKLFKEFSYTETDIDFNKLKSEKITIERIVFIEDFLSLLIYLSKTHKEIREEYLSKAQVKIMEDTVYKTLLYENIDIEEKELTEEDIEFIVEIMLDCIE